LKNSEIGCSELPEYSKKVNRPLNVPRNRSIKNKCAGFTLLELAITMLVIGSMIASVFSAQIVMDMSKVHLFEDDFRNIFQYINDYQDRYHAIPGDDPTIGTANSHLPYAVACTTQQFGMCMPGNGKIDGNWNDTSKASESFLIWQHLRLAEFLSGDTDIASANYFAKNAAGGALGVTNQSKSPIIGLKGSVIVCSDGISGKFVKQIDIALDDGSTNSGSMMATETGTSVGGMSVPGNLIDDRQIYLLCMGI
jgi:prepilin-type N-terminal cleavage/methylation domain-containing protein